MYRRDQRFWARRPLTADMVVYAAADVLALVPNIYLAMKRYVVKIAKLKQKVLCTVPIMSVALYAEVTREEVVN